MRTAEVVAEGGGDGERAGGGGLVGLASGVRVASSVAVGSDPEETAAVGELDDPGDGRAVGGGVVDVDAVGAVAVGVAQAASNPTAQHAKSDVATERWAHCRNQVTVGSPDRHCTIQLDAAIGRAELVGSACLLDIVIALPIPRFAAARCAGRRRSSSHHSDGDRAPKVPGQASGSRRIE